MKAHRHRDGAPQTGPGALGLGFAIFPLVAGAAILRSRLHDVDVVINRALVHGGLSVALGAAYLATVLLLHSR